MQTGSTFIILVTLAFMIYVNRFLWQQRQQEMGLYSMLGMTRRNLQVLTVIEKCYLLVISLFLGTLFGIIFDRLAFLGFAHLLQIDHLSQPWIEWGAVINTIIIIGGFFLILMVIDLIKLFRLNQTNYGIPNKLKSRVMVSSLLLPVFWVLQSLPTPIILQLQLNRGCLL